MSGNQISLFAGMNLGGSTKVENTSKSKDEVETEFAEAKISKLSREGATDVASSSTCGSTTVQSSFSFIRQSQDVKQRSEGTKCEVSSDKTTQLLDLFETLDDNESANGSGENKLLSYSDQLAEILPMSMPTDDTLLTPSPEPPPNCEPQDNKTEVLLGDEEPDLAKENIKQETNSILCDTEDDNESLVSMDAKEFGGAKYDLVLEPDDHFSLFCSQHSFKLAELRHEKDELKRNLWLAYDDVKNKIVLLEENLNSLRTKFDEVLSNDDYDLAAEINEKIEQLTIEKYDLQSARPGLLNSKAEKYLSDAATFREKETKFHEWALSKYNDLEKEQSDVLTEHRCKCTKEIDSKRQELKCQRDEINRSLEHLYLDKEHLQEDKRELDEKIDEKLEVFQSKKKELIKKNECLEHQIEMLEKKLKGLKSEKKEVEVAIEIEEDKMKEARKEFESLETRLKDKSEQIRSGEDKLNTKLKHVELQEHDLEETFARNKDKEESLSKNITYVATNKRESLAFLETSEEKTNKKVLELFLTKPSEEQSNGFKKLRTLEKEKAAELQDLELMVFNKEQKIMTGKKRLDEIENQMPEFEKTKKLAVTEHNFKEAKRLNEIIKQLSKEVETSKKEVLQMENTVIEEREKVTVLKDGHEALKKEILTAKERHDLEIFVRIVNKIRDLVTEKPSIHGNSFLETLRKAELDLLKTEFGFLGIPSESVVSRMNDEDKQSLEFVKEFLEHQNRNDDAPSTTSVEEERDMETTGDDSTPTE